MADIIKVSSDSQSPVSFRGRVSTSKNIKRKEPKLHHLKEKVNKWKEEGYEVGELEKLIGSVGNNPNFCYECGEKIEGNHKFCSLCGAKLVKYFE